MTDAFLQSLHERIAELEARRARETKAERLIINGKIGLIQAIIADYERMVADG